MSRLNTDSEISPIRLLIFTEGLKVRNLVLKALWCRNGATNGIRITNSGWDACDGSVSSADFVYFCLFNSENYWLIGTSIKWLSRRLSDFAIKLVRGCIIIPRRLPNCWICKLVHYESRNMSLERLSRSRSASTCNASFLSFTFVRGDRRRKFSYDSPQSAHCATPVYVLSVCVVLLLSSGQACDVSLTALCCILWRPARL